MRSLQQMTSRLQICTIITNDVVAVAVCSNSDLPSRLGDRVSVFASTMGKPALGKSFSLLTDTSVFLSNDLDWNIEDYRRSKPKRKNALIEVLHDRKGSREGKWSAIKSMAGEELGDITV